MHVVVDGSNLATEGRTLPSLQQLIAGVIDFRTENPDAEVVVVVDATFGHRIDASELPLFEDAIVHQEIVSPPAGAIGRGDAFVLRIAEKVGAVVLSNDSFQEFHAEHDWLFDTGRLIGGKPVPGVGWIFTPRTPVRGPRSREVTQEAKRKQRKTKVSAEAPLVTGAELVEKGKAALDKLPKARREKAKKDEPKGRDFADDAASHDAHGGDRTAEVAAQPRRNRRGRGPVEEAIALATVEAVVPDSTLDDDGGGGKRRKRRRKPSPPAEPVNEPGVFLQLVAGHRPGSLVEGEVETFSSHGAFITVEGARCYIPLTLLGDPAPRAARDVLKRGEVRPFVIRAFDAARRGVELAMPGVELPVGPVAAETAAAAVGAEVPDEDPPFTDEAPSIAEPVRTSAKPRRAKKASASAVPTVSVPEPVPARRSRKKAAVPEAAPPPVAEAAPVEALPVPAKRSSRKKPAAAEVVAVVPVAAATPARRSPRKSAVAVVEPPPAPVAAPRVRGSRKATPAAELPAATLPPPVAKRGAKKAVAPVVTEAPVAASPVRKRAAKKVTAPVEEVVAAAAPPVRKRATKKAAVKEAPASATVAKPPVRRSSKTAVPGGGPQVAPPPAKPPTKRAPRKKAADPS